MEPLGTSQPPPSFGFDDLGATSDPLLDSDPSFAAPPELPPEFLSPTEKEELSVEIEKMLVAYDDAMRERRDKEKEIEDACALVYNAKHTGNYPGAAKLVSEEMLGATDQAHARITLQALGVEPLVRVTPIESATEPLRAKAAESFERFFHNYANTVLKVSDVIPRCLLSTVRLGTGVVRASWEDPPEAPASVPSTFRAMRQVSRRDLFGRVSWTKLRNEDVVAWPAWKTDWADLEWAGHRTVMTLGEFTRFAIKLGLTKEQIDELTPEGETGEDDGSFGALKTFGIDTDDITSMRKYGLVTLWELYGNRIIPGRDYPEQFMVFYISTAKEKGSRILWAGPNMNPLGRHPYFPIRYKTPEDSSWSNGLGHEMTMVQASATMYRCLEADTLRSTAFPIYFTRALSSADVNFTNLYPGKQIPTEDPAGDVRLESLTDVKTLDALSRIEGANERRKMNATGLAAVLTGQGDPVMKSGGGTGSTMALIEQAGKKFGQVDAMIRRDLTSLYEFTLELVLHFAPDAVFVESLGEEDAYMILAYRSQENVSAPFSESFKMMVEAPSASNNNEMFKVNLMALYTLAQQHAQMIVQQFAQPIYSQINPAGLVGYMVAWADWLNELGDRVFTAHDVPGVRGKIPRIQLEAAPMEMMANQLIEQLGKAQQAVQMMMEMQGGAPKPGSPGSELGGRSGAASGGGAPL